MKRADSSCAKPVRVYFLGSGSFGIPVLRALQADPRVTLLGVCTQPARPAGRGRSLTPTPIGACARDEGLGVETPESVNTPAFTARLVEVDPELVLVVSFGQILRRPILGLPPFGCLNVHASLLPRHRGAAPVNAAILCGDAETGVTFMKMDAGLDTGPAYQSHAMPLDGHETPPRLEASLGDLAGAKIAECIWAVCRQGLEPTPQDRAAATCAAKITKQDGLIDWSQPAASLLDQMEALDINHMPVLEGDKVIGVVNRDSLFRLGKTRAELGL